MNEAQLAQLEELNTLLTEDFAELHEGEELIAKGTAMVENAKANIARRREQMSAVA